jgi:hypothetical protein
MASGVHDPRAKCVGYSIRERHRHGQPVTSVTGYSTRAAALNSSLLAALAAIAIEKIVLAILRRIQECWQPCQEKADKGKQEAYA